MAYIFVDGFKFGMDRRRPRYAGIPGTLWSCENGHLTRGGDIERCKRFVQGEHVTSQTFGLSAVNSQVYVFGSADLAASVPAGIQYQRLQAPSGAAMTRVLDAQPFDNKMYVIAEYADGARHHFYNGVRVTTWDSLADGLSSRLIRARALAIKVGLDPAVSAVPEPDGIIVTASSPGTPFTIAASAANGSGVNDQTATVTTLQANVAGVAGVLATAVFSVTGGTFDPNVNVIQDIKVGADLDSAVSLLPAPLSWISSISATATLIADTVNEGTDRHGYTASAIGSAVTITAFPGSFAAANAYTVFPLTRGDVTTTGAVALSGGVNPIAAQAQISRVALGGTFEPLDVITVTINGVDYKMTGRAAATGLAAHVQDSRVWSVAGAALAYCKLNDPTDWTDATVGTGAGRIIVSTDSAGAQVLTGIESYQRYAAVFAEDAIVTYALGANPANFERIQNLLNTGTLSGRAVIGYGANDVFYLARSGVRSLQARDSSNAAFVDDVGTVFDAFVQDRLALVSEQALQDAVSVIEPSTGCYWLAIENTVFVLANYPGTGVRGWTYYTLPFSVTGATVIGSTVYLRSATHIYRYGGVSGSAYPLAGEMPLRVSLPYFTARDDAGIKQFVGFDIGSSNEWRVYGLTDPNDPTVLTDLGRYAGVTYSDDHADIDVISSHLALDLVCDKAGAAALSSLALHHNGSDRR